MARSFMKPSYHIVLSLSYMKIQKAHIESYLNRALILRVLNWSWYPKHLTHHSAPPTLRSLLGGGLNMNLPIVRCICLHITMVWIINQYTSHIFSVCSYMILLVSIWNPKHPVLNGCLVKHPFFIPGRTLISFLLNNFQLVWRMI